MRPVVLLKISRKQSVMAVRRKTDQGEGDELVELGGTDVGSAKRGWKNTDCVFVQSNKDNSPSIKTRPALRKCYKSRGRSLPTLTTQTWMSKCAHPVTEK